MGIREPNEETAAICGLFCGICPSYPTQCHGCLSDKLTPSCETCQNGFRDCAREHQAVRCCDCAEFPCDKLGEFSKHHWQNGVGHHQNVIPDLQTMKVLGISEWVKRQTKEHTCPRCGRLVYWHEKSCGCGEKRGKTEE